MLKNYWKIAWRNLFRNRLHSAVNIGGLVIGFTVGIAILLAVYQQFHWDHQHVNGKRLYEAYQVYHDPTGDRYSSSFDLGPGPAYKAEASTIQRITRLRDGGNQIEYKGRDIPGDHRIQHGAGREAEPGEGVAKRIESSACGHRCLAP